MIELSLNEAAGLARKAARGSGLDWGVADEAARAVRWLCARNLPGLDALAALLSVGTYPPLLKDGTLDAPGPLCALRAGAAVSDLAALPGFDGLRLADVHTPLLILPFAAAAARATTRAIRIAGTGEAVTDGASVTIHGDWHASSDLTLTFHDAAIAPNPPLHRAAVGLDTLTTLETLAAQTYAPATETSRRLGAGP